MKRQRMFVTMTCGHDKTIMHDLEKGTETFCWICKSHQKVVKTTPDRIKL